MGNDRQEPEAALDDRTDADLLLLMGESALDGDAARSAWEQFYRRHVSYLYAVCLRAYGPLLGGEAGAADLVAEVFKRAYEHAGTFDDASVADAERQRLRARAWLGRIAQRLMQDALRSRGKLNARQLDLSQWQQVAAEPTQAEAPTAADGLPVELARQALVALSEKEQMVLRASLAWYQPGARQQRLPDSVCAELAATLRTTSENLRQIRCRAMKKVESYLRQRLEPIDANQERPA